MQQEPPGQQWTHFGFQRVPLSEKVTKVASVFSSVAEKYDLMNDLMSLGIHRIWKFIANQFCDIRQGHVVVDLAGGTGDLSAYFANQVGPKGQVILVDINGAMISQGRARLLDQGIIDQVTYVQGDAENLPFADNSVDRVCIGFGLRNVTQIDKALASIYRVLKPGGYLNIMEFSTPIWPGLQALYDAYSFNILPKLGEWVTGDKQSYGYLVESIRLHPNQETLRDMMVQTGFANCTFLNLTGGIVAIHKGYKF